MRRRRTSRSICGPNGAASVSAGKLGHGEDAAARPPGPPLRQRDGLLSAAGADGRSRPRRRHRAHLAGPGSGRHLEEPGQAEHLRGSVQPLGAQAASGRACRFSPMIINKQQIGEASLLAVEGVIKLGRERPLPGRRVEAEPGGGRRPCPARPLRCQLHWTRPASGELVGYLVRAPRGGTETHPGPAFGTDRSVADRGRRRVAVSDLRHGGGRPRGRGRLGPERRRGAPVPALMAA